MENKTASVYLKGMSIPLLPRVALVFVQKMTTERSANHIVTCSNKQGVCQFKGKHQCHGGQEIDDKKKTKTQNFNQNVREDN